MRKDVAILESSFRIIRFSFYHPNKLFLPLLFVRQFFALLRWAPRTDIFISQFAGYGSFLPVVLGRMMGKPSLIITGGTDCVSFPYIRYGNFSKKVLGWFTKKSLQWASALSSVSESLQYQEYTYDPMSSPLQGYVHWAGVSSHKDRVIYNGYEQGHFFMEKGVERKENSFLTVMANPTSRFARELKGLDLFFQLAKAKPEATFTVMGVPEKFDIPDKPGNVRFLPFADAEGLRLVMNQHRYYVQLSLSEGFPNALCEAMACGCVPIVSNVGAMPFIIQKHGVLVKNRSLNAVLQALESHESYGEANLDEISNAIFQRFPLEKRKRELLEYVEMLVRRKKGTPWA